MKRKRKRSQLAALRELARICNRAKKGPQWSSGRPSKKLVDAVLAGEEAGRILARRLLSFGSPQALRRKLLGIT